MSDPIFTSMKKQMNPSVQAQTELMDKLTQTIGGKGISWKRYAAVAACAALALCIYPAYNALKPVTKLHSYVTVKGGGAPEKTINTVTGTGEDTGDHDVVMGAGVLREALENKGFAPSQIDDYLAGGHHMTWALWYRYDGGADLDALMAYTAENQDWIDEVIAAYGTGEDAPNTGDLPGGAYVPGGDDSEIGVPTQPGADAYQLLMEHFGGTLPDWYGGAYVTSRGTLTVLLVNNKDSGDKSLELEVLEAVGGRAAPVGFAGAKYSRNELMRLNGEILALLDGKGIQASWGIYDDQNRIVLDTSEVLPDELLAELARLDPEGDAILVRVIAGNTTMVTDESVKGPAPIKPGGDMRAEPNGGSVGEEKGNEMQTYSALPALTEDGDKELEAVEPRGDDLPEANEDPTYHRDEQSVHYDLLPLPSGGAE